MDSEGYRRALMTFKSLINLGNLGKAPWESTPIERYHNDGHHHHEHRGNSKGKGSGAALSALTLLAFLFLLNIMQQSLQDNNSTVAPSTTAVLLRDTELPIILDNGEEKNSKTDFVQIETMSEPKTAVKGYIKREREV